MTRHAPAKHKTVRHVGILGGGAWGTALANVAARAGARVTLWTREPDVVSGINERNENERFLAGVGVASEVHATPDVGDLGSADFALAVTPAQHLRAGLVALALHWHEPKPIVVCAKGIEQTTGRLLTELVGDLIPAAIQAVLSGPSFARDVAKGLPTAVTLACANAATREYLATALGLPHFRLYTTDDVIGAQIGGAVKNVLAIAVGTVEGLGLGESARAALTTRGFAEMARLGLAMGAQMDTLSGLSGLGDLILTCSSRQSRNFTLGVALGEGQPLDNILAHRKSVTEGVHSAAAVVTLASLHGVEMPISEAVAAVIAGRATVSDGMAALLSRPQRREGVQR